MDEIVSTAFLKAVHPYAFRHGCHENAEIVGAKMIKPPSALPPRPCLEIKFADGKIDYVPLSEVTNGNYQIVDFPL